MKKSLRPLLVGSLKLIPDINYVYSSTELKAIIEKAELVFGKSTMVALKPCGESSVIIEFHGEEQI